MGAKQRIYTAGVLYYTVLKIRTDFRKGRQEDVMERNDPRYQAYVEILKEELIPAMGCTEPIALAYARRQKPARCWGCCRTACSCR